MVHCTILDHSNEGLHTPSQQQSSASTLTVAAIPGQLGKIICTDRQSIIRISPCGNAHIVLLPNYNLS